jgi:hypothetical protein
VEEKGVEKRRYCVDIIDGKEYFFRCLVGLLG